MTDQRNRSGRFRLQFSLRQLWLAVTAGCVWLGCPLFVTFLLWLATLLGATALGLMILIAFQTPCFVLFRSALPAETPGERPTRTPPHRQP